MKATPAKPSPLERDLSAASPEELLLYGLTLNEDDPALDMCIGVRRDLGVTASIMHMAQPGVEGPDISELASTLEAYGRRLEVAIELMSRAKHTGATVLPAGEAHTVEPGITP